MTSVVLTQPTQDNNDASGEDDMEKSKLTQKLLDDNNDIASINSVGDEYTNLPSVTSTSSSGENVESLEKADDSQRLMKTPLLLAQLTQDNNDATGEDGEENSD